MTAVEGEPHLPRTEVPSALDFPIQTELDAIDDILAEERADAEQMLDKTGAGRQGMRRIKASAYPTKVKVIISQMSSLIVAETDESTDDAQKTKELTTRVWQQIGIAPPQLLDELITDGVVTIARTVKNVEANSKRISEKLNDAIVEDDLEAYRLLRAITLNAEHGQESRDYNLGQIMQTALAYASAKGHQPDALATLYGKLENGNLDSYIGRELLIGALQAERQDDRLQEMDELARQVQMVSTLMKKDEPEAIAYLASEDGRSLWGDSSKRRFAEQKFNYGRNLTALIELRKRDLRSFILPESDEPETVANTKILLQEVAKDPRAVSALGISTAYAMKLNAEAKQESAKKRGVKKSQRQAGRTAVRSASNEETESTPEISIEPRKLVFVGMGDTEIGQDDPKFQQIIDEYAASHPDTKTLGEDVKTMLEFIASLDLSKGHVRGIQQYNYGKRAGDKYLNLFRLRADKTPGVGSRKAAAKTRVVFTLDPEKAGIVAIKDRDELQNWLASFGLGSNRIK